MTEVAATMASFGHRTVNLEVGHYTVTQLAGPKDLVERLQEMGFHKDMAVQLVGRAPFGGPFLIQFKTCFMALRAEEIACLKLIKY